MNEDILFLNNKLMDLFKKYNLLLDSLNNTSKCLEDNIISGKYIGEEELEICKNNCKVSIVELGIKIDEVKKQEIGDSNG